MIGLPSILCYVHLRSSVELLGPTTPRFKTRLTPLGPATRVSYSHLSGCNKKGTRRGGLIFIRVLTTAIKKPNHRWFACRQWRFYIAARAAKPQIMKRECMA